MLKSRQAVYYNVTLWRVRVITIAVKPNNAFCVLLSSCHCRTTMHLCETHVAGNNAYCPVLHRLLIVLLQTRSLAEKIVMTDQSWCSWSVCVSAARDQKELVSHEAVVIVTYSECVSVLLFGYPACRPRHYIAVCGLSGFTIALHIISWMVQFSK
jgi:hypothetical protein